MTNQWIDNRYEITRELMRSDDGIWYIANDTALKREIIILVTESNEYEALLKTQREMMDIGDMSNDAYLQILNAGRFEDNSFIIFQAYSGMPLYQYVEKNAVALKSVLQWVYRAGQLLQDGQRVGLPEFSVSFDNLWITDDHEILVMNYWKEARSSRTGTTGLTQLLYQCCTLHALAPRQLDIFVSRMQSALKQEQPAIRQSVLTLVNRTLENDPSLISFMAMLKEIMEQPLVPFVEPRAEVVSERKVSAEPVLSMDTMMFTSDTAQELRAKLEQERSAEAAAYPTEAGLSTDIEELMSSPNPGGGPRTPREEVQQPPAGKRSLKMKIIAITAGCVVFFGLIGTAILWANSLNDSQTADADTEIVLPSDEQTSGTDDSINNYATESDDQNESSVPNTDVEEEQAGTSDQIEENTTTEPEKELVTVPSDQIPTDNAGQNNQNQEEQGEATTPDTSGPATPEESTGTDGNTSTEGGATVTPGIVPNLVGLTQEEAEKQALAAGLKYSFKKENAEGTEAGKVFKQEPAAGTEFKKGDRVTFYVARGK